MFATPISHIGSQAPSYSGSLYLSGTNGAVIKSTNAGSTWSDIPVATGYDGGLRGVYRYSNTLMAYGNNGFLQSSTDGGTTWVDRKIPYNDYVTSVLYNLSSATWVVALRDRIYTSQDLAGAWTYRTRISPFNDIYGLANNGATIVAVGANNTVATSTNGGVSWTTRSFTALAAGIDMYAVTYGGGLFVAVGESGSIQTSADGVTWSATTISGAGNLNAVIYHGSTYIVVGDGQKILTSTDGVSWVSRTPGPGQSSLANFSSLASDGTNVVCVASNNDDYQISTNGVSWTKRDITVTSYTPATNELIRFFGAVYDSTTSRWIMVGDARNSNSQMSTSNWKTFCVQASSLTTSWAQQTMAGSSYRTYTSLIRDSATGNLYAVADGTTYFIRSTDAGATWTFIDARTLSGVSLDGTKPIGGLWHNGSVFIFTVAGTGKVYKSADFSSWSLAVDIQASPVTDGFFLNSKCGDYINSKWVVLTANGIVVYSSDSITWSVADVSATNTPLYSVCYGLGYYFVTSSSGKIFRSSNLTSWSEVALLNDGVSVYSKCLFNGGWVYVYSTGGLVYRTSDGTNWVQVTPSIPASAVDTGNEFTFSISSNKGKVGLVTGYSLYKTYDYFTLTQMPISTAFYSPVWRSALLVPS